METHAQKGGVTGGGIAVQMTLPCIRFEPNSTEIRKLVRERLSDFWIYQKARADRRKLAVERRRWRAEYLMGRRAAP